MKNTKIISCLLILILLIIVGSSQVMKNTEDVPDNEVALKSYEISDIEALDNKIQTNNALWKASVLYGEDKQASVTLYLLKDKPLDKKETQQVIETIKKSPTSIFDGKKLNLSTIFIYVAHTEKTFTDFPSSDNPSEYQNGLLQYVSQPVDVEGEAIFTTYEKMESSTSDNFLEDTAFNFMDAGITPQNEFSGHLVLETTDKQEIKRMIPILATLTAGQNPQLNSINFTIYTSVSAYETGQIQYEYSTSLKNILVHREKETLNR